MEAVAAHARIVQLGGNGESPRHVGVRRMERGIEAGHLRQVGPAPEEHPDRREIVRLMQRRERHELLELRHDRGVHPHRRRVLGAAVDDPMADRRETVSGAVRRLQPVEDVRERAIVSHLRARFPALLACRFPGGVLRDETGRGVDALDLPAGDQRKFRAALGKQRELDAG